MIENLSLAAVGSIIIVFIAIAFLNKAGIIPVFRIGTAFKAFIILTLVLFISFTYTSCKQQRLESGEKSRIEEEREKKLSTRIKVTKETATKYFYGTWQATQIDWGLMDSLTFDKESLADKFDLISDNKVKIQTTKYGKTLTDEFTFNFYNDGNDLELESNHDGLRYYNRVIPKQTVQATPSPNVNNKTVTEEPELEAQPIQDTLDTEMLKEILIGKWKNISSGRVIEFTSDKLISEEDKNGMSTEYQVISNGQIQIIVKDYRIEEKTIADVRSYNHGAVLDITVNTNGKAKTNTYSKAK
jgi:hypothetical protein